ncbi:MAG: KH domain-containing protein [Ruminiclostridium sp.]|nr:KH domain-containing protein [Ruminiclostridium sp.]
MERFYTAKTEELAKEQAVNEFRALGIGENDITFEIVEQPVKKLFTMKGDYRIRAYAPDTAAAEPAAAEEPAAPAEADEAVSVSEAPEQKIAEVPEGVNVLESEKVQNAIRYLDKVLGALGVENYTISTVQNDDTVVLDIVGEKLGVIIGRRGETLDALQYLTILASNKAENSYCRIAVDCNGYRAKRKETLEALAVKTAHRVLKQGRRVTLEPMNPYERRIIHSKVAEIDGVFSNSIGEEPFRKVVISSNTKPTYNKGDRGDRGGRRGGDRRNYNAGRSYKQSSGFSTSFEREYKRSQPSSRPSEPDPAPFSQETVDIEKNTSLYGKIEL